MDEAALGRLTGYKLSGGFTIARIRLTNEMLVDAIGREAVARTAIVGLSLDIELRRLSDEEISISLYHEVLEASTVATAITPRAVAMFNEGDFERAARHAHAQLGPATAENLDRMLQSFGFGEQ